MLLSNNNYRLFIIQSKLKFTTRFFTKTYRAHIRIILSNKTIIMLLCIYRNTRREHLRVGSKPDFKNYNIIIVAQILCI